jgi:hypothetical protein
MKLSAPLKGMEKHTIFSFTKLQLENIFSAVSKNKLTVLIRAFVHIIRTAKYQRKNHGSVN